MTDKIEHDQNHSSLLSQKRMPNVIWMIYGGLFFIITAITLTGWQARKVYVNLRATQAQHHERLSQLEQALGVVESLNGSLPSPAAPLCQPAMREMALVLILGETIRTNQPFDQAINALLRVDNKNINLMVSPLIPFALSGIPTKQELFKTYPLERPRLADKDVGFLKKLYQLFQNLLSVKRSEEDKQKQALIIKITANVRAQDSLEELLTLSKQCPPNEQLDHWIRQAEARLEAAQLPQKLLMMLYGG